MPKIPNFLRPSVEVARERMLNTVQMKDDNCIHALLGNRVPELTNAIERLQVEIGERLHVPLQICPGVDIPMTATELALCQAEVRIRVAAEIDAHHASYMARVYGDYSLSDLDGCLSAGTCMPHRPEPPLRKTVSSVVLEQKRLT